MGFASAELEKLYQDQQRESLARTDWVGMAMQTVLWTVGVSATPSAVRRPPPAARRLPPAPAPCRINVPEHRMPVQPYHALAPR
jgi:hypothetical protein